MNEPSNPLLTLSIVSHGQGALVHPLLRDIERQSLGACQIVLTLNIPEDEMFLRDFPRLHLHVLRNASPGGFGANHNAAFRVARGAYFAVVNPDVRLSGFTVEPLLELLHTPNVGICAPAVYSPAGTLEDSARKAPTMRRLLQRKLMRGRLDYPEADEPFSVDWVAGMFMLFRREVFQRVDGFDERYFMYFEDADICARVRRCGWDVVVHPGVRIGHDARRASRRDWRHFRWHVSSAFRYLTSLEPPIRSGERALRQDAVKEPDPLDNHPS